MAVIFVSLPFLVLAQDPVMEQKCLDLGNKGCANQDSATCKKSLDDCAKYYDAESARIEGDMQETSQQKKTLQSKITGLNNKIKDLTNKINQSNLLISDLKVQITDTSDSIEKTIAKIEESKKKLANILRVLSEEDKKPLVELLITEPDLSGFFDNVVALDALNLKHNQLLKDIKDLKNNLEDQKNSLDGEKVDLENTVKMHELQKQENASIKKEKESTLKITEQEYQKQLQEKTETQKKASAIRARIFDIAGGATKAPTFGEAYEIAKYVSGITGIRPSFLLAVLQQESAIGKNVGQCYLTDTATGSGKKASGTVLSRVMHPTRDVPVFVSITSELGREYTKTPVSCPMSFGYGGAMGPAQFIPSTWSNYRDRIKAITGKPSDPWNIKDAFLAAGLFLTDLGAGSQTYKAEWTAAMKYFSGGTSSKYSFYGNSVMKIASGFDGDIALLNQFSVK